MYLLSRSLSASKSTIFTHYINMSQKDIQQPKSLASRQEASVLCGCLKRHHIWRRWWMVWWMEQRLMSGFIIFLLRVAASTTSTVFHSFSLFFLLLLHQCCCSSFSLPLSNPVPEKIYLSLHMLSFSLSIFPFLWHPCIVLPLPSRSLYFSVLSMLLIFTVYCSVVSLNTKPHCASCSVL